MRSFAEVSFRARQEAANLYLLGAQPRYRGPAPGSLTLPDPHGTAKALQGSVFADGLIALAEKVLTHRFPVLALEIETGREISWRRDYVHEKESRLAYLRRVPYLDFGAVGDHKIVWELNRHQHLVLLAQAYLLTGNANYVREVWTQLESWIDQNPFQRGINWTSALEVAFRTLSWIWVYHFVGPEMPEGLKRNFLTALYRHGLHLFENLSVYFSPNTHLLGEAVALYAVATLFPNFAGSKSWRKRSHDIVMAQLDFQMKPDGSHFEQSTYYHVYAVDFFLLFYLLSGRPEAMKPALVRMADYLYSILGSNRKINFQGDDDGGRLFHPYGARNQFGRATLATCGILLGRNEWIGARDELAEQAAWWLGVEALELGNETPAGNRESRFFADSGALFLHNQSLSLQMDCGPFGYGGAGHSHSDTLSICLESSGESILVDPGTYTYMGDPAERNWFRGSGAHNTVRVNETDQAKPAGPFRWSSKPAVSMQSWKATTTGGAADAQCSYEGITHRRRVLLQAERLLVLDEIEGSGSLACEQNWQLGTGAAGFLFRSTGRIGTKDSWYSPGYGVKLPGRCTVIKQAGESRVQIVTSIEAPGESSLPTPEQAAEWFDQILSS